MPLLPPLVKATSSIFCKQHGNAWPETVQEAHRSGVERLEGREWYI